MEAPSPTRPPVEPDDPDAESSPGALLEDDQGGGERRTAPDPGQSAQTPRRRVVQAEALAWLAANPPEPGASVVTSLPDVSELDVPFDAWRAWFVDAARAVLRWSPVETVFFQSDVRRRDGVWVDKGYLVQRAAEEEGASLVWRKVVCRRPPGTIAHGRASYSHMLCFARGPRPAPKKPGPDVLASAGRMPWSRAMGEAACEVVCRYLRDETSTRVVVDPFCGHGTALVVAARHGFDVVGVDKSARQVRAARRLLANGLADAEEGSEAKVEPQAKAGYGSSP